MLVSLGKEGSCWWWYGVGKWKILPPGELKTKAVQCTGRIPRRRKKALLRTGTTRKNMK